MSATGEEVSLESAAIKELAGSLQGNLYLQADAGYSAAKQVWNGMFDYKQPAMVLQCTSIEDVVNAVNFARERNLLISVKCGGHSLPGKSTSDGGMMIDLGQPPEEGVPTSRLFPATGRPVPTGRAAIGRA
jgi:FAD/FMN-containing dehydrogenase